MKQIFGNKSIGVLFLLLMVSIGSTIYLNLSNQKNMEEFAERNKDTMAWVYFTVSKTYAEVDKFFLRNENLEEADAQELEILYGVFIGSYNTLGSKDHQELLEYNCADCQDREYLKGMRRAYDSIGTEIKKVEALSVDGFGEDVVKLIFERNKTLLSLVEDLGMLANQKHAVLNSEKQRKILSNERILFNLVLFQIICFIAFSIFALYQIASLLRTQNKLEHSNKVVKLARAQNAKAYESRNLLIGRLAHEMRTPLTAILGFSQILKLDDENPLNEEQNQNVSLIEHSGSKMSTLLNKILDFSILDAGQISLNYSVFNPNSICDPIKRHIEALDAKESIKFGSKESPELLGWGVKADLKQVTQIALHLTDNSVKYGLAKGGVIELEMSILDVEELKKYINNYPMHSAHRFISLEKSIEEKMDVQEVVASKKREQKKEHNIEEGYPNVLKIVEQYKKFIVIEFIDSGVGIEQEHLPGLFEEFNRGKHNDSPIAGYGMGLSMSRKLATLMHGTLLYKDNQENGCCFTLILPAEEMKTTQESSLENSGAAGVGEEGDAKGESLQNDEDLKSIMVVVFSTEPSAVDEIAQLLSEHTNMQHICVTDVDFAKDIIDFTPTDHLIYTDHALDESFKEYLKDKNIPYTLFDPQGYTAGSVDKKQLSIIIKGWNS